MNGREELIRDVVNAIKRGDKSWRIETDLRGVVSETVDETLKRVEIEISNTVDAFGQPFIPDRAHELIAKLRRYFGEPPERIPISGRDR